MTQLVPVPDRQEEIPVEGQDVTLTILIYKGRLWFTMRQLCAMVGISGVTRQVDALIEDGRFDGMLTDLSVKTRAGRRPMTCIDKEAVGGWLNHISHRRVRDEAAPNVLELQLLLMKVADRVLFSGQTKFLQIDPANLPDINAIAHDTDALKHYALLLEAALGDIYTRLKRLEEKGDDEQETP